MKKNKPGIRAQSDDCSGGDTLSVTEAQKHKGQAWSGESQGYHGDREEAVESGK